MSCEEKGKEVASQRREVRSQSNTAADNAGNQIPESMSKPAITTRNLSKSYRLGSGTAFSSTFREAVALKTSQWFGRRSGKDSKAAQQPDGLFHALRDVSFDIERGQVVGVIGHNGAGKSTLLKILSRITDPTAGSAAIRGRVASLLEVGTGFHSELTGRENIYLNGAVLGMTRAEIRSRFDEIVAFSGVDAFLDTPVKRYSSGMTVRLAFAVAAHLRPEILLVDEVLAVGDVAFQKKCLGKLHDVVNDEGRTVLFVSHNMDSVRALCSQVMVLEHGTTLGCMEPDAGIRQYYAVAQEEADVPLLQRRRTLGGKHAPVFADLRLNDQAGSTHAIPCGGELRLNVELRNMDDVLRGICGILIRNEHGQRIALFNSQYHADMIIQGVSATWLTVTIPNLMLAPGRYYIDLAMHDTPERIDYVERAATLDIVFADLFGTGKIPDSKQGHVVLPSTWKMAA